MNMHVTLN